MAKRSWWFPPRSTEFRPDPPGKPIDAKKWFQTWVLKGRDKAGQPVEERCISIKLPIWGMYYSINSDDDRWGQLTFQYRGRRGCFLSPVFPIERSTVDTGYFNG